MRDRFRVLTAVEAGRKPVTETGIKPMLLAFGAERDWPSKNPLVLAFKFKNTETK